MVVVSITETAIYESIYILRAYESVTSVWCNLNVVTSTSLIFYRVTLTPTECSTDCPVTVDVVTNLWEELISSNSIAPSVLEEAIPTLPPT